MISIILAGGFGSRMNSHIPKVLLLINRYPLIFHVIRNAFACNCSHILIVVGKYRTIIEQTIRQLFSETELETIHFINQPEFIDTNGVAKTLGTGHAVNCCLPFFIDNHIDFCTNVLILSGDVPLIKTDTILNLMKTDNSILITNTNKPFGCGRIMFNGNGSISRIVEEKDCTALEKKCTTINCGIYNMTVGTLLQFVPLIQNNNAAGEYYLTDLVEIAIRNGVLVNYYLLPFDKHLEIVNINTKEDLDMINSALNNA
jgi:bifunctional UDP-N-acetylglucosamine pyrophosphorylase/glucosamine-1-phosphate N-acetyltransferase